MEETETAELEALPSGTGELDPALQEGLRVLDNSQALIRTIFLGLAMQYHSMNLQRCQILQSVVEPECTPSGPSPQEIQIGASLIILCALFGFQKQSEQLAAQSAADGACPDMMDVKLGAVVILVALIRLTRLTQTAAASANAIRHGEEGEVSLPEEGEELAAIEELAEPVL